MAITLYYAPGSCSLAAHAALIEASADFEAIRVTLSSGDQNQPEFRVINPRGRIPALVVNDVVVTETIALLSFIASQYPGAQLLPNDNSVLLARAYELMSWYASSLHVAIAQIWRTERFTPDPLAWSAVRSGGLKTIRDGFAEIETMCTDTWLLGVQYSVVDAYTYVFWRWGHKLGFDMTAYPKWSAHSERLRARPSVAHVLELEKH